ncbi:MAG TPA: phosphotransferase [Allosphingosinicella sp.]
MADAETMTRSAVATLIRDHAGPDLQVERLVFGTSDPDEVAALLIRLSAEAAGEPITGALFYRSSVGAVAGLVSASGARMVIKAHQPSRTLASLRTVADVQRALALGGFVCPSPIGEPVRVGDRGFATFEAYFPDPGQYTITQDMLPVSAAGLADLALRLKRLAPPGDSLGAPQPSAGSLYPPPHSPLFDFEGTSAGAEWIDLVAAQARRVIDRDGNAPVVLHGDWSAANVRFTATALTAVYDWDSLILAPLSRAVGVAAVTWSAYGSASGPVPPSPAEVRRYVDAFENVWGEFTPVQREAAYANAVYCLAYTARCEHSLDPEGKSELYARSRLMAAADALLPP